MSNVHDTTASIFSNKLDLAVRVSETFVKLDSHIVYIFDLTSSGLPYHHSIIAGQ